MQIYSLNHQKWKLEPRLLWQIDVIFRVAVLKKEVGQLCSKPA